jgi:hypothetical protein
MKWQCGGFCFAMAASSSSALRRWFMPSCSPPPTGLAELPTSSKAISSIPNGWRRFHRNSSAGCFRPSRRGSFRKCSIENREITARNADEDRSPLVLRCAVGTTLVVVAPVWALRATARTGKTQTRRPGGGALHHPHDAAAADRTGRIRVADRRQIPPPRSSLWRPVPPRISAIRLAQSARSLAREISTAPGRAPFGRPAIPIDIAAFSYHWSALKIARLIFFFSGLACDSDFLALVDLEVLFFDIFPPASLYPFVVS